MKSLKDLTIGEAANILTEKQMKALKGGNLYCHCNNDSSSYPTSSCANCYLYCYDWYVCDGVHRG
ncbi:MAG: TIGR04149 family rSAM-modified RiPP [Bacteroidaceae bacterium]|nr:TIGR04149 family rSAM-modified RiPP [Bacteroidaceae bacterium]